MKFEFQNLGTIKKTTLDLRPLTVIVGPNNTNKTYLAYCVHGLLSSMSSEPWSPGGNDFSGPKVVLKIADVIATVRGSQNRLAREFASGLTEYFQDSYRRLFEGTKLGFQVDEQDIRVALQKLQSSMDGKLEVDEHEIRVNASPHPTTPALRVLTSTSPPPTSAPMRCDPTVSPRSPTRSTAFGGTR